MAIQLLSDSTIAQIAAGEVVERPASVVKELVENAVDSGATHIHVSVQAGGRKLIRVSDDGSGIQADEVELAFLRHATSKLRSIDDLATIATLGFRGEALSSIASVSRLSAVTRHREEAVGTRLTMEGSTIIARQSTGAPVGTVISVENLFYNTPARLKFLKKESTEKRHINALITRYAMAYPDVRFILEQDGREIFRSTGSGQLADVIVRALGLDSFRQMLEVAADRDSRNRETFIRVYGFTSAPELNRSDRSQVTLFVNGRWIQDNSLTYAVIQAYHNLLEANRYPVAVLMIDMEPQDVDVNVHPTKAQVRFREPDAVFAVLQRAVRQAVISRPSEQVQRAAFNQGIYHGDEPTQADMPFDFGADYEVAAAPLKAEQVDVDPTAIPEGLGRPQKPRTLPMLRVVGQVGASYIVAEGPAGMYLIDQSAAHERVLFEQYIELLESDGVVIQQIAGPQTVELPPIDARKLADRLDDLRRMGFVVEAFGPDSFIIRGVPDLIGRVEPAEAVLSLAQGVTANETMPQLVQRVCCVIAVKSGQVLSQDEMQSLIRKLERCESPYRSPTGHATLVHMSGDQIAREFRRT